MKNKSPLEVSLRESLEQYLIDLNGMDPTDMYEMVINRVELPLLEVTMELAQNNQSRAALMLGLTRNTLRKKLIAHKLLNNS
jgi:Fis family transcriptional regulator